MGMYRDFNDYEVMYLVEEQNEDAREILFQKYKPIILKIQVKKYAQQSIIKEIFFCDYKKKIAKIKEKVYK